MFNAIEAKEKSGGAHRLMESWPRKVPKRVRRRPVIRICARSSDVHLNAREHNSARPEFA